LKFFIKKSDFRQENDRSAADYRIDKKWRYATKHIQDVLTEKPNRDANAATGEYQQETGDQVVKS
jgi:hypothetical protein